jgi:hypothetical protein
MINSSNTVQLDQHVGGGESLTAAVAVALESNDCSRRGSKQTPRLTSLSGQLEQLLKALPPERSSQILCTHLEAGQSEAQAGPPHATETINHCCLLSCST